MSRAPQARGSFGYLLNVAPAALGAAHSGGTIAFMNSRGISTFYIGVAVLALIGTAAFIFLRTKEDRSFQLTPGGEPVSVLPAAKVDLSFCDDTLATSSGTLCAIKPSATDPRILNVSPSTGKKGDAALGFGYHVVAFPDDWENAKGVWIHFTGSYGRPYDQRRDAYESSVWLDELVEEGYIVMQLAYDNRFSVNGELCGMRNEGHDRDNCAGEVREITQSGKGTSPYRSTDQYNSIDYRLASLIAYIEENHHIDLAGISATNWSTLRVSGHSQGANQAYYIAKERPVAFACIIAGGFDTADTVNPGPLEIADWFTDSPNATAISKIGAFLTTTDDSYEAFYQGLTKAVGLPAGQIIISDKKQYFDKDGTELNGHNGAIKDPTLKELRAEACFL